MKPPHTKPTIPTSSNESKLIASRYHHKTHFCPRPDSNTNKKVEGWVIGERQLERPYRYTQTSDQEDYRPKVDLLDF